MTLLISITIVSLVSNISFVSNVNLISNVNLVTYVSLVSNVILVIYANLVPYVNLVLIILNMKFPSDMNIAIHHHRSEIQQQTIHFHSPLGVLFTFPSQYLILFPYRSLYGVFSLPRWSS
jgi:hypothetical protein